MKSSEIEFLSCVPVYLPPRSSSEEGARRTLRAFVAIVECNAFVNVSPIIREHTSCYPDLVSSRGRP